jgi:hypothetical protein
VATNDDKHVDTLQVTNGEMATFIGTVFDVSLDDICEWAIIITSHVHDDVPGTHDIRVSSNAQDDNQIRAILERGMGAL